MKVALVTGGGSGIGRALCLRAADDGCHVHVADIEEDRARSVAEEIREAGGKAQAHHLDVTDRAALAALFASLDQGQGLDLLFANAGVMVGGPVDDTDPAEADWLIAVNLMGVFDTARLGMPLLRKAAALRGKADLVITGSEHSLGRPDLGGSAIYTASKHAVLGLAERMRADLAEKPVSVALLCPGLVATDIADGARNRPKAAGGPQHLKGDLGERIQFYIAEKGQDPAVTARLCFEGIERGDFLIITDPENREFTSRRAEEVDTALKYTEAALVDRRTPR